MNNNTARQKRDHKCDWAKYVHYMGGVGGGCENLVHFHCQCLWEQQKNVYESDSNSDRNDSDDSNGDDGVITNTKRALYCTVHHPSFAMITSIHGEIEDLVAGFNFDDDINSNDGNGDSDLAVNGIDAKSGSTKQNMMRLTSRLSTILGSGTC
jgi:hypothetical protein